jgi:hypothetical protein
MHTTGAKNTPINLLIPYPWWSEAPLSLIWSSSALSVSMFRTSWSYKTVNDLQ